MKLAAIAAEDQHIAFSAYLFLVAPTLRDVARRPLRRARHNGRPCTGTEAARMCDDCEETIADHLMHGFTKLREALHGGQLPRTKGGVVVREMEVIHQWVTSPEASSTRIDAITSLIKKRPHPGEPAEVRAFRAQCIHHELHSLEARVRRADAKSRGAATRPERDLRTADWSRPLRDDPAAFDLLLDAILRVRHGARDLYAIPADLLTQHRLDWRSGYRLLRRALGQLRELHPEFHRNNAMIHLDLPATELTDSPEDLFLRKEERREANAAIQHMLAPGPRGLAYQRLLKHICAATPPLATELIPWTAAAFEITLPEAETLVRETIHRVATTDVDVFLQMELPAEA
ncbi:hypothetical protein [Spongiactinospora sp. 9N601]|uniref:hypothetical protein n=1 Tax=Spongiactinospora sp. 9N601 TaxID=3375149 RepID=UPI003794CEF5